MVRGLLDHSDHRICGYNQYDEKPGESTRHHRLAFVQGDIRSDSDRLEMFVRDCDMIIDLIAYANPSLYVTLPLDVVRLNFHENPKIAELCVKHRWCLMQFSTCEVYGKIGAVSVKNLFHLLPLFR